MKKNQAVAYALSAMLLSQVAAAQQNNQVTTFQAAKEKAADFVENTAYPFIRDHGYPLALIIGGRAFEVLARVPVIGPAGQELGILATIIGGFEASDNMNAAVKGDSTAALIPAAATATVFLASSFIPGNTGALMLPSVANQVTETTKAAMGSQMGALWLQTTALSSVVAATSLAKDATGLAKSQVISGTYLSIKALSEVLAQMTGYEEADVRKYVSSAFVALGSTGTNFFADASVPGIVANNLIEGGVFFLALPAADAVKNEVINHYVPAAKEYPLTTDAVLGASLMFVAQMSRVIATKEHSPAARVLSNARSGVSLAGIIIGVVPATKVLFPVALEGIKNLAKQMMVSTGLWKDEL